MFDMLKGGITRDGWRHYLKGPARRTRPRRLPILQGRRDGGSGSVVTRAMSLQSGEMSSR